MSEKKAGYAIHTVLTAETGGMYAGMYAGITWYLELLPLASKHFISNFKIQLIHIS